MGSTQVALNSFQQQRAKDLDGQLYQQRPARGLWQPLLRDGKTAEEVWRKIGSNFSGLDANGNLKKFRLLEIVEDKIPDTEKVTKLWKSTDDKSGKATPTDRILMICHEDAKPRIFKSNEEVFYER